MMLPAVAVALVGAAVLYELTPLKRAIALIQKELPL
jgi:hypothetical protein